LVVFRATYRSSITGLFHVTEYLANISYAAYPGKTDKPKRTIWLDERCKQLKREPGAVETLISEMEKMAQKTSLTKSIKENLQPR